MSILVLDFDGVICNGSHEVFLVGLKTYIDLNHRSRLAGHLAAVEAAVPVSSYDFASDPLLCMFEDLTPLGNRAEDFGAALLSLDQGVEIPDQAAYDAFVAGQDTQWLAAYHQRFYENRAILSARDRDEWLALMSPYSWFVELLRKHAEGTTLAIATAKDADSVRILLEEFGISELIPDERLLDKEVGVRKTAHLSELAGRLGVAASRMTFVDDKLNHLQRVATLGVRCVLAGWGYNGEREHRCAEQLGFEIATPDTTEVILFGAAGRGEP
jgi:phosphoglycolate phosphatase-like HAD superfamily hydrolase